MTLLNKLSFFLNRKYTVGIICLILAMSVFLFVWFFGVNILFLDEWSFAELVKKFQTGGLNLAMLFQQHNEHRIFFPKLFYLALLPVSHMNSKMIMFIHAFIISAEFVLFYLIAKKQYKFTFSTIPVWILTIPLFVFNFRQWQNLIWAFQIAFYMVLIFSILAIFFTEKFSSAKKFKWKLPAFVAAIVCGIIATFSSAMGFLVWPAVIIQLLIKQFPSPARNTWIYLFFWVIAGTISFVIYNNGLNSSIHQNILFAASHPLDFIRFFFCLISLTSVHSLSIIALPIGIIIFMASLFGLYRVYENRRWNENSFWISLYTFSLLFSILTTIGRCPVSFEYTDRSRYTIFTALLIISTFALLYDNYRSSSDVKVKKFSTYFFIMLVFLGIGLDVIGLAFGRIQKKERLEIREIILNYKDNTSIEKLKNTCPWCNEIFLGKVKEYAPFIDNEHYNVFYPNK